MRSVAVMFLGGCSLIDALGDPTKDADATVDTAVDSEAADGPLGLDAPSVDAPVTVIVVSPCTGESASVESLGGFRFEPSAVTITIGQIVKFTNASNHSIVPVFPTSGDGLRVGFGEIACLQFSTAGTFNYRCNPHSTMTGTITVN